MTAAVGVAGIILLTACDSGTTAGPNWVITPDVDLHRNTGEPLITGTGQCGNGFTTWIARSVERNAWDMTQGQTLIASCYPGYPIGTWGIDDRPS